MVDYYDLYSTLTTEEQAACRQNDAIQTEMIGVMQSIRADYDAGRIDAETFSAQVQDVNTMIAHDWQRPGANWGGPPEYCTDARWGTEFREFLERHGDG